MLTVLSGLILTARCFSQDIIWTNTSVVYDVQDVPGARSGYGSEYGRMQELADGSWLAAYTTAEKPSYQQDPRGGLVLRVSRSRDKGKTWTPISLITDEGRDLDNAQMILLKDNSLLLACRSVRWQESYRLQVYKSRDNGVHWAYWSQIDANEGKPGTLGHPDKGIYEPHLYLLGDGRLSVLYANEKHVTDTPAYSQIISQKTSADGGATWDAEQWVAHTPGLPDPRPGMPVWTRMANGVYIAVYEVCGPQKCNVYYKTSPDGEHWPEGIGDSIPGQLGGPFILSCRNGMLVVSSNSSRISVSHDYGKHWQTADPAWPASLWSSIYEISPGKIAVMNSVARPKGGHSIQLRFGRLGKRTSILKMNKHE